MMQLSPDTYCSGFQQYFDLTRLGRVLEPHHVGRQRTPPPGLVRMCTRQGAPEEDCAHFFPKMGDDDSRNAYQYLGPCKTPTSRGRWRHNNKQSKGVVELLGGSFAPYSEQRCNCISGETTFYVVLNVVDDTFPSLLKYIICV